VTENFSSETKEAKVKWNNYFNYNVQRSTTAYIKAAKPNLKRKNRGKVLDSILSITRKNIFKGGRKGEERGEREEELNVYFPKGLSKCPKST
jgi:hypothetical protein